MRIFLHTFPSCPFNSVFSSCTPRLKSLSRIILAFVLTAAVPAQISAFRQLDPLAAQKAGIEDGPRTRMERDMAKKANQARQADLKRDTEKLLKLATDLKESVDKSTESTLSGCDQEGGGNRKAGAQREGQDESSLQRNLDGDAMTVRPPAPRSRQTHRDSTPGERGYTRRGAGK